MDRGTEGWIERGGGWRGVVDRRGERVRGEREGDWRERGVCGRGWVDGAGWNSGWREGLTDSWMYF